MNISRLSTTVELRVEVLSRVDDGATSQYRPLHARPAPYRPVLYRKTAFRQIHLALQGDFRGGLLHHLCDISPCFVHCPL